jgi:hypothetical protein
MSSSWERSANSLRGEVLEVRPEGSPLAAAPPVAIAASADERCGGVALEGPAGVLICVVVKRARSFAHAGQRAVPMGLHVSHWPQTIPISCCSGCKRFLGLREPRF